MDFNKYNEEYSRIVKERKALEREEQILSNKFVNDLIKMNRKCKFFKTKDVYTYLDSHWKSSEKCDASYDEPNHIHAFNGFSVYTGRKKNIPTLLQKVYLDLSCSLEPCGEDEFVTEVNKILKNVLDKHLSEMGDDEHTYYYSSYIKMFEKYGEYFSEENHETLNKIKEKCVD